MVWRRFPAAVFFWLAILPVASAQPPAVARGHGIASAQRLVDRPISEIRGLVGNEFRGVSTCTHLNDTLRRLGDLGPLADELGARASMPP